MRAFCQHHWLGNVRELENVIQRLVVLGNEKAIIDELTPLRKKDSHYGEKEEMNSIKKKWPSLKETHREAIARAESEVIHRALEMTHWNRKKAAELLNVSYKALLYKMKAYGIHKRISPVSQENSNLLEV